MSHTLPCEQRRPNEKETHLLHRLTVLPDDTYVALDGVPWLVNPAIGRRNFTARFGPLGHPTAMS
jgi:hypothetical protein